MAYDFGGLSQLGSQNLDFFKSLKDPFAGISNVGDVQSRFGMPKDVTGIFNPLKKQLGIQRGQAINTSLRSAGKSATPGMTNTGIETGFAGALQGLLGKQGEAQYGLQRDMASFLERILGQQGQFGLQKAQGVANALGGQANILSAEQSAKGPAWYDYLLSGVGNLAGPAATYFKPTGP